MPDRYGLPPYDYVQAEGPGREMVWQVRPPSGADAAPWSRGPDEIVQTFSRAVRVATLSFSEDYHGGLPWEVLGELERRSVGGAIRDRQRGIYEYRVPEEDAAALQAMLAGYLGRGRAGGPTFDQAMAMGLFDQAMAAARSQESWHVLEFDPALLDSAPAGTLEALRRDSDRLELHGEGRLAHAVLPSRALAEDYRMLLLRYHDMDRPPPRFAASPRQPRGEREAMEAAALAEFGARLPDVKTEIPDHGYLMIKDSCRVRPA